jgi:hypothetical protein
VDPAHGKKKIWSESNVSKDFDMVLRLLLKSYVVRWLSSLEVCFKEGVSHTREDELKRCRKYSYSVGKLMFNPLIKWLFTIWMGLHRAVDCAHRECRPR